MGLFDLFKKKKVELTEDQLKRNRLSRCCCFIFLVVILAPLYTPVREDTKTKADVIPSHGFSLDLR